MNKKIIKIKQEIKPLKKVVLTKTSLTVKKDLSIEEWLEIGKCLKEITGSVQWWIGDWLNEGEKRYGEMYSRALDRSDYKYMSLAQFKYVAKKIESSRRLEKLSFYHHLEVAKLTPKEQRKWLKKAEQNEWSVKELRLTIREEKRTTVDEDLEEKIPSPFDKNMFYFLNTFKGNFGKDVLCINPVHGETNIREYKDYYPTITKLSKLYHPNGKEFTLREYAKIQDFPEDFKFVGIYQEIKNQIVEAVSPMMSEYVLKKHIKGKNYIELFCGCGGFSAGAEKLGKKCIWANDFNRYAAHSYKLNFPKTEVSVKNIQGVDEKKIHKKIGNIDFIIGSPPCQGFSFAGKRLGFKKDKKNQLYLDFVRFVKEFKPEQFIMENVKQVLEFKDEIIKDFKGYSVITETINGLDIGMKQKRIRAFFIGTKK